MKVTTTFIQTLPAKLALGLFITFPILSSCEDPSNLGLELDPNNNQIGVFYQEIPLTALVVLQDSLQTTNPDALVFGSSSSEFFGKAVATAYTRMLYNRDVALPEPNAVLDSVRFNFRINAVYGDNLSSEKTIKVHRLNEQIRDITYYNFNSLEFNENPIFEVAFDFSTRQDTLVFAELVENEFVDEVFEALKDGSAFSDIFTFREFLPGLVFKGSEDEDVTFDVSPGNSTGFIFFFRNEGDTVSRAYPVATGIGGNNARHFNQITLDRTGTPVEMVTEKFVAYDLGEFAGSKNNTGFLVKLDMSPLDEFLDTLVNITFNQVELELGPLKNNISTNRPPQFLEMAFTNELNRLIVSNGFITSVQSNRGTQVDPITGGPFVSSNQPPALLAHDRERNVYRQTITSHVNAIYRGNLQRQDFLLWPSYRIVRGSLSEINDAYRESLREFVLDSRSPVLKIYYSKARAF